MITDFNHGASAPPSDVPEETRRKLQAAQADIDSQAEAVERSAKAISRARDLVESAHGELARLETDQRAVIERGGQLLESWILDGNSGAPPTAAESNDTDIAKGRAEVSLEFEKAKRALAALERRHSDNRNKQLAAHQRLESLERAVKCAHVDELVDEAEGLARRLQQIGRILFDGGLDGVSTQRSEALLNTAMLLPVVQQMAKAPGLIGGTVANLNSSVAGDARGWQVRKDYWDEFRAMLKQLERQSAEKQEHDAERAA